MQKLIVFLLYKVERRIWRILTLVLAVGALAFISASTTWYDTAWYSIENRDSARGGIPIASDPLGDGPVKKIVYLNQNWSDADSLWFYSTTQGSDLLPYDFFLEVEQADSTQLFRSPENMNLFRYLPQSEGTQGNPDGLPVGMVADTYRGKKYFGFTCAACHTSQVNFNGYGMRIDGGSGAANMDLFMHQLEAAFAATQNDPAKLARFSEAVRKHGHYDSDKAVRDDLSTYLLRLRAYNYFNESYVLDAKSGTKTEIDYGYDRLDAFGRIYNRVIEHVTNPDALRIVLKSALPPDQSDALLDKLGNVLSSDDRDAIMASLMQTLSAGQLDAIRGQLFNSPNAPVSYPFIWDIPQHDYVQWNGIGVNAGAGPLGRNTGEVIGVFATLDWTAKDRTLPASLTGWLGLGPKNIVFQSSANGHNLGELEDRLWKLWAPSWKDASDAHILPQIDPVKAERGEHLYALKCASCHAVINRTDPNRRVVARMDSLTEAGTDPAMAKNSVNAQGYSGILKNQYVNATEVGSVLLNEKAPVAALLTKATELVVATPSPDKWFLTRGADWLVDLLRGIFSNKIKSSVKSGSYAPDTTGAPFQSLLAYKGRPLDGIWATGPYLHNGSVPTLYDLLLPAGPKDGDPPDMKYRPDKFITGSRELDPVKVGLKSNGYKGFPFDTSLPGNRNTGHEYCTRELSDDDRWALVEYMKTL